MAQTRLGSILEQEYKSKGLISGATSAIGKRARESMDFRNVLFGGSGLGSIIGRKIFGKGYSANRGSGSGVSTASQQISDSTNSQLDELNLSSRITAKNTLALPSMARDMHLVKQNIVKLVKLQSGTPTTKAGDWFQRQAAREAAYESKFGVKTPTKIGNSTKSSGGLAENTSLLSGLFGSLGKNLLPIVGIASMVGLALGGLSRLIMGILRFVARTPIGRALGLGAAALGLSYYGSKDGDYSNNNTGETPNEMSLMDKTLIGAGAVVGTTTAIKGTTGLISSAKQTSNAILDARTTSAGQLAKSQPTSTWGKFLKFLAKRDSTLFKKVGTKLAQAGALMAIPIGGWVMALINLGFASWTAWEIYKIWKEFKGLSENKESSNSTEPTQVTLDGVTVETASPSSATSPSSIPKSQASTDMADLIRKRFKDAGFNNAQAEAAVANAIAESGLDPKARNNSGGEDSVGLFQMNRKGGLGAGHTVENLMDPNYNIDLAIAAAKKSKAFMSATSVSDAVTAFVKDVEKPKDQASAIKNRIQIANGLNGNGKSTPEPSNPSAGSRMASNSAANEDAKRNSGNTTVNVNNTNNNQNNQNGGGQSLASADVMDTELGRLLLTRMYY